MSIQSTFNFKPHFRMKSLVCLFTVKGVVRFFFKWGHIKYISKVGLFPTVITDQRSLSLEKQRAAPAQTLSFVLQ